MGTIQSEFERDLSRFRYHRAVWEFTWPFHCSICEGYGAGLNHDKLEICTCVLKGQCPRCGANKAVHVIHGVNHDHISKCSVCGWDQTKGGAPVW